MSPARRPKRSPTPAPAPPPPPDGLPLPGSEHRHPPLGIGLWGLGRWDHASEERTRQVVERAFERHVGWFDTAEVYGGGRSERILGDALARLDPTRPAPFVSTKVSWEHLQPAQVRASMTGSLQRLGQSSVDLYLVHAPDAHRPIGPTMTTMAELLAEGKTRAIGVSNFGRSELEAAIAAVPGTKLAVNQLRYNLLDHEEADAVLPTARAHGIVLEAYSPIARGLLAGRYLGSGPVPPEVRRFAHSTLGEDRFAEVVARAKRIRAIAKAAEVPMMSIALHWLARRGAAPIVGASKPAQVDEILAAWAVHPADRVLDEAEAASTGTR